MVIARAALDVSPGQAQPSRRVDAPSERRRRSEIVEMIRAVIETLRLKPGDRLPGERQLAARFGVSRGSVREALQYLAIMGLLEIRHGGGSYLKASALVHTRHWWRRWVVDNRVKVLETLELRLGAEAFAARLAAQRAGPEDLDRLVGAMRAMRAVCASPPVDTARFVECDIEFHDAMLQAAGNGTLRDLIRAATEQLLPERAAVTNLDGRAQRTYQEHLTIFDAVRAGDAAQAAEAMSRHIVSVRHDVLLHLLGDGIDNAATEAAGGPFRERRERGSR
jgi:GntR family transcriptional repressor for pyruvate dehydrogenase complex